MGGGYFIGGGGGIDENENKNTTNCSTLTGIHKKFFGPKICLWKEIISSTALHGVFVKKM